jgi:hypothetical protein
MSVHLADKSGILIRYQGLQRYIALEKTPDSLRLVQRLYSDTILDEMKCTWKTDELHAVKLVCRGTKITAFLDGEQVLQGTDGSFGCGGAGFFFENGNIGVRELKVF